MILCCFYIMLIRGMLTPPPPPPHRITLMAHLPTFPFFFSGAANSATARQEASVPLYTRVAVAE